MARMETIYFSKMLVSTYVSTWRHKSNTISSSFSIKFNYMKNGALKSSRFNKTVSSIQQGT